MYLEVFIITKVCSGKNLTPPLPGRIIKKKRPRPRTTLYLDFPSMSEISNIGLVLIKTRCQL